VRHALDGLISWPAASTASIRQEQIRRSSSVIEQAPQSPEAQPSLEPVRPAAAQRVEHGVAGSQRNSIGSPLMDVVT
jgi:hypothetical protein